MQNNFDRVSEGDKVFGGCEEKERFVVKHKFISVLILDWLDRKKEKPYIYQMVDKKDFNKYFKIL